jgi:hypothetical protein
MTSLWTPWGLMPLRTNQAASDAVLGGSLSDASVEVPFLAFPIEAGRYSEQDPALHHATNSKRGESACPTTDVSRATQDVARET